MKSILAHYFGWSKDFIDLFCVPNLIIRVVGIQKFNKNIKTLKKYTSRLEKVITMIINKFLIKFN